MNAKNLKKSSLKIVVKAEQLFNAKLDLENQEKIVDECTALIDGDGLGSPFGSNNRNQTTVIYDGSEMEWSIELSGEKGDENYEVVLDSIKQGSSGFFTKLYKENGDIIGTVTTNPNFDGKEEPYTILFHIAKKGSEDTVILPIDPRLRVKQ